MNLPKEYAFDSAFTLGAESSDLTRQLWPNFLIEESDIPEPGLRFEISQDELVRRFPAWGIRRTQDRKLVGYANAVLIALDPNLVTLPDDGWRFAIEASGARAEPNTLCLLAANVEPSARGLGLAEHLIEAGKRLARDLGLKSMVGPVRPVRKFEHHEMPMEDYATLRSSSGEVFDPWLRLHSRLGAEVLNVCANSVVVRATLGRWREWTGLALDRDGAHEVTGGLAPLLVDLNEGQGIYREPNIWVRYEL